MTFNISAKNTQTIFENYTQLEKMPNEVHEKIFSYLDIQSLLNLSSTNRCLRNRVVKKMLDDIDIYLSNIIIQLGGEKYENEKVEKAAKISKHIVESMFKDNYFYLSGSNHWYSDFGYNEINKLYNSIEDFYSFIECHNKQLLSECISNIINYNE